MVTEKTSSSFLRSGQHDYRASLTKIRIFVGPWIKVAECYCEGVEVQGYAKIRNNSADSRHSNEKNPYHFEIRYCRNYSGIFEASSSSGEKMTDFSFSQ